MLLSKTVFLFLITTSLLYSQSTIKQINVNENWEKWVEDIPVSGELRVGFQGEYSSAKQIKKKFYAQIPENYQGKLCAIISSKDGRYRANVMYNLTPADAGLRTFEWNSDHYENIKDTYNPQNLVILCRLSENCNDSGEGFIMANWSENSDESKAYMMLNSEVKPKLKFDKKSHQECECKEIQDLNKVSYNYICSFPKTLLETTKEIIIVQKMYMLDEITYEKIIFPLAN